MQFYMMLDVTWIVKVRDGLGRAIPLMRKFVNVKINLAWPKPDKVLLFIT
jgi:hypothetical protein